jgi:hypothetical protein
MRDSGSQPILDVEYSSDAPHPSVGPIYTHCLAEHQPVRNKAPRTAIGTVRAVIAHAEVVPGLHIKGFDRKVAKLFPLFGIRAIGLVEPDGPIIDGNIGVLRVCVSDGIVGVATELD